MVDMDQKDRSGLLGDVYLRVERNWLRQWIRVLRPHSKKCGHYFHGPLYQTFLFGFAVLLEENVLSLGDDIWRTFRILFDT